MLAKEVLVMSFDTQAINITFCPEAGGTAFKLTGDDTATVFHCKPTMGRWDAFLNSVSKVLNAIFGWKLDSLRTEEVLLHVSEGGDARIFMRVSDITQMNQQAARVLEAVHAVAGEILAPVAARPGVEDAKARQRTRMQELENASPEELGALLEAAEYKKDMFPSPGDESSPSQADFEALRADPQFVRSCHDGVILHLSKLWGWRLFNREKITEAGRLCPFQGTEEDVQELKRIIKFSKVMFPAALLGVPSLIDASLYQSDKAAWEKTYHSIYLEYLQNLEGRPPGLSDADPVLAYHGHGDSHYWKTMFPSKVSDDFDLNLWSDPNFGKLYLEGVRLHILKQWGWDIDRKNDPQYKPPTREEWTPDDQAQLDEIIRSAEFVGKKKWLPDDDWWPLPQPAPNH